ncbi:hypothetical protein [Mesoflavibacter zeaxanthinifaciens]|uniref:hypothetical protein n=1 Tax=Mesoflavibacter zeaxanthinifaciens TaxID=393060 RepID=UPI003A922FF4
MIKILIKISILTVIMLSVCYSTFYLNPDFKNNYLSAIKLKLDKLEKIDKNKIVIIGGSNVCFGINSEEIENSLGVPVVNMGLHASLGPKFWLEYVKSNLNPGDIVLISPEYGMLTKEKWYGMKGTAVPKTILYTPSKLGILFSDYTFFKETTVGIFRTIKAYWENYPFKKEKFLIKNLYDSRSFEEDNIRSVYLNSTLKKKYKKEAFKFDLEKESWNELKEYKEYFAKNNIAFYLVPASVLNESIDVKSGKQYLKDYSEYSQVPILNDNFDYFYNRNMFFDTNYHLNIEGGKTRTKQLTEDIKKVFFESLKLKERKKIFLSKYNFEEILLDSLKRKHNVKVARFKNDSIIVTPTRNNKMGFLQYKTNFKSYIGSLLKVTIKANSDVIDKLEFRGVPFYSFDYVKKTDTDTYVLCKSLSNTINSPKSNKFSSIGIGYSEGKLGKKDAFTVLKAQIINEDLNCEDVSEYLYDDIVSIPKNSKKVFFKVNNFESKNIPLNELLNIDSEIIIENKKKYTLYLDNNEFKLFDFYKEKTLAMFDKPQELKFINNSNYRQEIEVIY